VLSGNLSTVKISGKSYLANLIGFDEYADLAVLKINEQDLKHIEFSDEAELEIGQTCLCNW
jgi:S1-C subfamily serine protease